MNEESTLKLNGKLWIELDGVKLIGPGRVELLERIQLCNSIRQAALQMKMSYRQAWQLVDQMNANLRSPVVLLHRGGKGGGHAELTDYGLEVIEKFNLFFEKFHSFIAENTPLIDL